MAVGTVTFTHDRAGGFGRIVATCTASSTDGTFPATDIPVFAGELLTLHTNPGAVQPQDDWDVTLVDDGSVDRLQGLGANRDTLNSELAHIVYSGTAIHPACVNEKLTLTVAGNNVNSAVI